MFARAPPRLPSFLLHPPMKKKKKITGMLKLQRAPQHCGKPSPLSQPLNLFLSFVCLFFVCYFSAVQTTARGSDRVYFDDKKMASCVICVHSCFDPASRALAHDGLPFWHQPKFPWVKLKLIHFIFTHIFVSFKKKTLKIELTLAAFSNNKCQKNLLKSK